VEDRYAWASRLGTDGFSSNRSIVKKSWPMPWRVTALAAPRGLTSKTVILEVRFPLGEPRRMTVETVYVAILRGRARARNLAMTDGDVAAELLYNLRSATVSTIGALSGSASQSAAGSVQR
jgi:hypothetical protein